MDTRWFKEDREKFKGKELAEEKKASEKALRGSTLMIRRLKRILEDEINATYLDEEAYEHPAWERKVLAAAAERKAYRQVLNLLPSKEVKTNDR